MNGSPATFDHHESHDHPMMSRDLPGMQNGAYSKWEDFFPLSPAEPSPISFVAFETFMEKDGAQVRELLISSEKSSTALGREYDVEPSITIADPPLLHNHGADSNPPDSWTLPGFRQTLAMVGRDYNTLPLPPLPLPTKRPSLTQPKEKFALAPLFTGPPPPIPTKSEARPSGPFMVLPPPTVPESNNGSLRIFTDSLAPAPSGDTDCSLAQLIDVPSAILPNTAYTSLPQFSELVPPPVPPKDTYGPSPRVSKRPPPVPPKDSYEWLPLIPLPLFAGRPPVPRKDERNMLRGGSLRPDPISHNRDYHIAKYPRKPLRRVPAYENMKVGAGKPNVPH